MTQTAQNLLITDDHVVVRKGIIASIQNGNTTFRVLEANSFISTKQMLEQETITHLILDLKLDDCSLLESFQYVRRNYPDILIMALTATPFSLIGQTLLQAGVSGYLSKKSVATEMSYGINHFLKEGNYFPPHTKRTEKDNDDYNPFSALSQREMLVTDYLLRGMMVKQIAHVLSISVPTVSTYKARVLNKLKVESMMEIGKMASIFNFPI
jgi:two-component system, NarL family, invasion response regulator UvrY